LEVFMEEENQQQRILAVERFENSMGVGDVLKYFN
jgi:hypothetical protein